MKELLNIEGYGLTLIKHEDKTYELIDGVAEPYNTDHYSFDNRADAIDHIASDILDRRRCYAPDELPDDLKEAYANLDATKYLSGSMVRTTAHTFLCYVLDTIAAHNEWKDNIMSTPVE